MTRSRGRPPKPTPLEADHFGRDRGRDLWLLSELVRSLALVRTLDAGESSYHKASIAAGEAARAFLADPYRAPLDAVTDLLERGKAGNGVRVCSLAHVWPGRSDSESLQATLLEADGRLFLAAVANAEAPVYSCVPFIRERHRMKQDFADAILGPMRDGGRIPRGVDLGPAVTRDLEGLGEVRREAYNRHRERIMPGGLRVELSWFVLRALDTHDPEDLDRMVSWARTYLAKLPSPLRSAALRELRRVEAVRLPRNDREAVQSALAELRAGVPKT